MHHVRKGMLVVALLSGGGCRQAMISVSDTFVMDGGKSMVDAKIEQQGGKGMSGVPGVPVAFYVHDQKLGDALTDAMGVAKLDVKLPDDATHYRAEARVGGDVLKMDGLVFGFPRDRTVIVCDIDGTVSMTHYRSLVFDAMDMASTPFPDAAAVLTELSKDYGLVYLTARPGFLLEKSKDWLMKNGFPRAPVVTTPGLSQSIAVESFKSQKIKQLSAVLGGISIGIGNATTDSEAYAMQSLVPIIIDDHDDNKFRSHAIVLRNWKMVRAFFEANSKIFMHPQELMKAVRDEEMIQRPMIRYQGR